RSENQTESDRGQDRERDRQCESSADVQRACANGLLRTAVDVAVRARRRLQLGCDLVTEDRPLELLQRRSGLDPELFDEPPPRPPVELQRFGLSARAVQGKHQLDVNALAKRMLAGECLEIPYDEVVPGACQVGVYPIFDRSEANLLEPADLLLSKGVEREVGEWRTPPEIQRFPENRRG